jgi:hypothetical protein
MVEISRRLAIASSGAMGISLAWPAVAHATSQFPKVTAFRNPGCGCCEKWAGLLTRAGFDITMTDDPNLNERHAKLGIPDQLAGCHTALVGDYIIEGHVPPEDVVRFLAENPVARGLAVPGMPMESPGMETGGPAEPYNVLVFMADGSSEVYVRH